MENGGPKTYRDILKYASVPFRLVCWAVIESGIRWWGIRKKIVALPRCDYMLRNYVLSKYTDTLPEAVKDKMPQTARN